MTTSTDIAKRALALIGARSTITGLNDGSAEGNYAGLLYNEFRDFLLRKDDHDFSAALFATSGLLPPIGVSAPYPGSAYWYQYPPTAIKIRTLIPTIYTPLDPQPIQWNVFNYLTTKYISSTQAADAIVATFAAVEDNWDAAFTETMVRYLGSGLSMALENRMELSKETLREALAFADVANTRSDV